MCPVIAFSICAVVTMHLHFVSLLLQVESDMRDGNRPDASVVPGLESTFTEGLAILRDHLNGLQSR